MSPDRALESQTIETLQGYLGRHDSPNRPHLALLFFTETTPSWVVSIWLNVRCLCVNFKLVTTSRRVNHRKVMMRDTFAPYIRFKNDAVDGVRTALYPKRPRDGELDVDL